jgi:hypothetical protein
MSLIEKYIKKFKKITIILVLTIIIVDQFSCAKQAVISELDFQKNLLAGTGGFQNVEHTWKIDSMTNNGAVLVLTTAQKRYKKTFKRDGSYYDSDGNTGSWLMPTVTDLTIISTNGMDSITSKIKKTYSFKIADLNSAQLFIKYDSAGSKQDLHFIISN